MELLWLFSLCQCLLSVAVIVVSVRLCMVVSGGGVGGRPHSDLHAEVSGPPPGSVSCCLRLCLGWVGAIGGVVGIPVTVLLNLRSPQCLYTCITLLCCPLLVRQFSMWLLVLLTLDCHLQRHLADRYPTVVTRKRCLCVILLCWVASVLSSFAQFITSDFPDTRQGTGLGLDGNRTDSPPGDTRPSKYHPDRKVIGKYLPYGGFLSKFYTEDTRNFTYAEIHGSHWGICAPDAVFSPAFLLYVHGTAAFLLPSLCLLAIYLHLLFRKPKKSSLGGSKHDSSGLRPLALSLSLLIALCLPLHVIHALLVLAPGTDPPVWTHAAALFLFQLYGLAPQLLFTPSRKSSERRECVGEVRGEAAGATSWGSSKCTLKVKECPKV